MRSAIGNPNYQGPFGNMLLHGAVLSNDRREVERLLSAGADPRIANREGRSPLQVAELLGHAELYQLLNRHSGVT
jgi:ankyrin repeat protein